MKIECNHEECNIIFERMTPKTRHVHEINRAFKLSFDLLVEVHAGGKKLIGLLNPNK